MTNKIEQIMLAAMRPPSGDPDEWTDQAKLSRALLALDDAGFVIKQRPKDWENQLALVQDVFEKHVCWKHVSGPARNDVPVIATSILMMSYGQQD